MRGDEVLAVRSRRALYEFVRASPGYHLREIARELLQERAIFRGERGKGGRVDVDLRDCHAVLQDRDDDLGPGVGEALEVSRVLRHVADNDRCLRAGREPADALADRDSDVLRRLRAGPCLEDELVPLDQVHAHPRVLREPAPELLYDEVEDRLRLAPAPDDSSELLPRGFVVRLALLARHHLAELADSLHGDRLARRTGDAGIRLASRARPPALLPDGTYGVRTTHFFHQPSLFPFRTIFM